MYIYIYNINITEVKKFFQSYLIIINETIIDMNAN